MTTKKNKDNVLYYLQTLFGQVFDTDIIKSVATNFEYDVQKSSNFLLEMTTNKNETSMANIVKKKNDKTRKSPQHNHQKKKNDNTSLSPSMSSNSLATIKNKSKRGQRINDVINEICKGYKVLILLRGPPGSGKSHLAKIIIERLFGDLERYNQHVFSTDDFFFDNKKKIYSYNPNRLTEAHEWNQRRTFTSMKNGYSPIIIDNTNTQMWEMKTYAMMAIDFGYIIEILEPDTQWLFNDKELARRNQHNVPKEKIRDMLDRYDKNVTTQKLLSSYSLSYRNQRIPQFRSQPPLIYKLKNGNKNIVKSKSYSGIDQQSSNDNNVNLMDFNETTSESISSNSSNKTNEIVTEIDEILMSKSEDSSTILKPDQVNQTTNPFDDFENAWGIDEKALQSWDVVTPINVQNDNNNKLHINSNNYVEFITTTENSTMTENNDFNYLENYQQLPNGYKLMNAKCRDLNGKYIHNHYEVPKKTLMLDKSCLTDDQIVDERDDHLKLQHLKELFISVPRSYIRELYEKCNKDFNWVVELLLDNNEINEVKNNEVEIPSDEESNHNETTTEDVETKTVDDNEDSSETNESLKNFRQKPISEESKELKKLIESKIDINKEHYSDHVFRVKQLKFGSLPSTSKTQPDDDNNVDDNDDNSDSSDTDSDSDSSFDINPKEMVELNLGDTLVQQLELKFGGNDLLLPKGFQPIVQVPINLARQLYMLHIESVCQQMETQNTILEILINEDEEFAKKLQQQEFENNCLNNNKEEQSISFNEIMEEQAIASRYQKLNEQWKYVNVDTLALKLTKQKLFETFPNIDKNVLLEVLHAYNNDYYKTVEDLCASFGVLDVKEIVKEPPLSQGAIQEMKDDEANCQEFMDNVSEDDNDDDKPATFYREKADKHLKNRLELYQKAQNYYQKGMIEVAMFYSDLARKETNYYDRANHLAATQYLNEHSKRLQKFDTLDLHFLYVKEALSALDLFIDQNINLLQDSNKMVQDLFIITGRGRRSDNGVAKIKPAIISRLKKRQIKFVQLNPGLLKIKVGKYSPITSGLS